jgi:P-type conjugative transfer protein TrbJ
MKKIFSLLVFGLVSFFAVVPAQAQIPVTDIASQVSQGRAFAQQILQYTTQGLQLQAELKNLINNPTSLLGAEVGGVINDIGRIMSSGNSIGGNMARIDANFATTFKNPQMASMSQQFTRWHATSTDTLGAAMKAAGLHRDSYQSDQDALTALYNQSQATQGNLQAMQTLAQINAMQVQQMQKLGDLMATQNIAANTFMAEQTARAEAKNQDTEAMKKAFFDVPWAIPALEKDTAPRHKWNMYSTK